MVKTGLVQHLVHNDMNGLWAFVGKPKPPPSSDSGGPNTTSWTTAVGINCYPNAREIDDGPLCHSSAL